MNDSFSNIIKVLTLPPLSLIDSFFEKVREPSLEAWIKYSKNTRILTIKEKTKNLSIFAYNHITKEHIMKEVKDSDASQVSGQNDISAKMIKLNVTLAYKSGQENLKINFRPLRIYAHTSKLYEKCLWTHVR